MAVANSDASSLVGGWSFRKDNLSRSLSHFVSLWDGDPTSIDRRNPEAPEIFFYQRRLTALIMGQVNVVEDLLFSQAAGNGFTARCLPSMDRERPKPPGRHLHVLPGCPGYHCRHARAGHTPPGGPGRQCGAPARRPASPPVIQPEHDARDLLAAASAKFDALADATDNLHERGFWVQISPSALDVDDLIATFAHSTPTRHGGKPSEHASWVRNCCSSPVKFDAFAHEQGKRLMTGIEFRDRLREAAVLIIPTDLRPEYEGPVFPIGTSEVFRYLSDNMDNHAIVEAAILDEDYIEFEHRSETLILPVIFIAKDVLLLLVVNLLGSFIHERLKTRRVQESEPTVKSKVHYERADGEKFLMDYEGPADTFEKIVLQEIKDSGPNKGGPSPKTWMK